MRALVTMRSANRADWAESGRANSIAASAERSMPGASGRDSGHKLACEHRGGARGTPAAPRAACLDSRRRLDDIGDDQSGYEIVGAGAEESGSSFPRTRESMCTDSQWIPAFAGM